MYNSKHLCNLKVLIFRAKRNMLLAWQMKLRGKQNLQTLAKFHGTLFIAVFAAVNN